MFSLLVEVLGDVLYLGSCLMLLFCLFLYQLFSCVPVTLLILDNQYSRPDPSGCVRCCVRVPPYWGALRPHAHTPDNTPIYF